MRDIGLKVRFDRIVNPNTGRTVIIPFDHGIAMGPIHGIEDPKRTVHWAVEGGANAIVFQTGLARILFQEYANKCGTIFKLTNTCIDANQVLLSTVEDALRLGADAVSVELILGSKHEALMLENVQRVYSACLSWGMPLLIMLYHDESSMAGRSVEEMIAHTARAGAELGGDIVKVAYTGDKESFKKVVAGCPAPVVVAGGPQKGSLREVFQMVRDALDCGAIGIAMGRNVWQYKDPVRLIKALTKLVHEDYTVDSALAIMNT